MKIFLALFLLAASLQAADFSINVPTDFPRWYRFRVDTVANGVGTCTSPTGCFKITCLDGPCLNNNGNNVMYFSKPVATYYTIQLAGDYQARLHFSGGTLLRGNPCQGATTIKAGFTGFMETDRYVSTLGPEAYDLTLAEYNYPSEGQFSPKVGGANINSNTDRQVPAVGIRTTGGNISSIADGCAFFVWAQWSIRPAL